MVKLEKSPPRAMSFDKLHFHPRFAYPLMAEVVEVAGLDDMSDLSGGFARFSGARIPWTVDYDELILVLEGELAVETGSERFTAGPLDTIWLPRGTQLNYVSDDALVFYSLHPASRGSVVPV